MPNRGELPIPATRDKTTAKSRAAGPDADAWTIIAFCAIGGLLSFCLAISSIGVNGYPAMMMQMPMDMAPIRIASAMLCSCTISFHK